MPNHITFSFIGLHDYEPTTYAWKDELFETPFIQEATHHFFEPDRVLVAMTPAAREKQEDLLQARLSFERLDIPDGQNEEEWWTIFETIADAVPPEAHLTIDITHGFRSQPVIALAIAVYLQAARDVTIERIVYGRFEKNGPSPILDLTPFLDMIEWSVAARQFVRDGNADVLASMMVEAQNNAHKRGDANPPQYIKAAGKQLKAFTDALSVVRVEEVTIDRVDALVDTLDDIQDEVEEHPRLRPLEALLERVKARVHPMHTTNLYDAQGFAAQAEMMRFFLETNQVQQAVTLAREALVSHQAVAMGLDPAPANRDDWDESGRGQAEKALVDLSKDTKRTGDAKALGDLWSGIGELRNDINHAGMNTDPGGGKGLVSNAQDLVEQVIDRITSGAS